MEVSYVHTQGCRDMCGSVAHLTNGSAVLHGTLCEMRTVVVGIAHKDGDIAGYSKGNTTTQRTITNKTNSQLSHTG